MRELTKEIIFALGEQRLQLLREIPNRPTGLQWCSLHSDLADQVAKLIFGDLTHEEGSYPELALIATGGFGRSELCPKSDIDITVVPGDGASTHLDPLIRQLFQDLHWAFGTVFRLDVGYAYRLISDTSGLDEKTRTGLLDMRLLAGSESLFEQLQTSLAENFPAGEFLLAKIRERQEMYARFHDTPLVIEPQLKEGAGGLRDFHCSSWIGKAIGEKSVRPTLAYDTILKYRNLLHFLSEKMQDTLTRSRQVEISEITGLSAADIIREVANSGQELHATYERSRERVLESRFTLSPGVFSIRGEVRILPDSTLGSAAVGVAIATELDLKVTDLPSRPFNPYAGPSAAFAIAKGEKTLRNLDRCSLLSQLVPELTHCRFLNSDENAHTYTVMEHTLRVIRNLDSLDSNDFLAEIKASLTDLEPLYLGALLHDVGKADLYSDHSLVGSRITEEVGKRWELSPTTIEAASWLVREHLTMARFIRIRDLAHPATIEEFSQIVQTPERLKMLTLLTWADIHAVSPDAWTSAQATFLKILFERCRLRLEGDPAQMGEVSKSRQRLLRELGKKADPSEAIEQFLDKLPAYYLTSTNADLVRLHKKMADDALAGTFTIEHHHRPDLGATELTVCAMDHPGLLSQLLGALYSLDLSLAGIRACTMAGEQPVAIDVFTISFGGRPVPHATMATTSKLLKDLLTGVIRVEELMRAKGKDPDRRQKIVSWKYIPGIPGILELKTPRGRGMPYRFSRLFATQSLNILAARVSQWAGSGTAAFYLAKADGAELTLSELKSVLNATVDSEDEVT